MLQVSMPLKVPRRCLPVMVVTPPLLATLRHLSADNNIQKAFEGDWRHMDSRHRAGPAKATLLYSILSEHYEVSNKHSRYTCAGLDNGCFVLGIQAIRDLWRYYSNMFSKGGDPRAPSGASNNDAFRMSAGEFEALFLDCKGMLNSDNYHAIDLSHVCFVGVRV